MLGYRKENSIFLPSEHLRGVYTLTGIIYPIILLHGRIAGRWKEEHGGLRLTLFKPLAEADRQRVADTAERLWPKLKKIEWL